MILREFIIQKTSNIGSLSSFLNNKINLIYLNEVNNNIPIAALDFTISEKLWYYINEIKEIQKCECGNKLSYIGPKNGYRKTCGNKECFVSCRKKTSMENWGVDNPTKSKDIQDKTKQTILQKYDGKHYMYNEDIRNKFKTSMNEKYGVDWAQQNSILNYKSIETWSKNDNKVEISKLRSNKNKNKSEEEKNLIEYKKKKSKLDKYGENYNQIVGENIKQSFKKNEKNIENYRQNINIKKVNAYKETIINKLKSKLPENITYINKNYNENETDCILQLFCEHCDNAFSINRQLAINRIANKIDLCLNCNPILSGKSNMELDLLDFIKSNYTGVIITSTREVISPLELDIYVPEFKIAFEFNGLYWHSEEYKEKNYHLNKTLECQKLGINLIHIWEDDWLYKQEIVKSMILNKLGKSTKIFARKCEIKEVNNLDVRRFLDFNHIQGFVGSTIKLGLYYNNELVSLMTFGNLRKSLNTNSKQGYYELLRFCNKLNFTVIGGASKLFTYFIKNYKYEEIISYSDYSRSTGNMYLKLRFNLIHLSKPNYYYIIDNKRNYRFNFRKDILVKEGYDKNKTEIEIMHERGYKRLFDCGMQKWIYKI